jgi:hypothetical protein
MKTKKLLKGLAPAFFLLTAFFLAYNDLEYWGWCIFFAAVIA